MPRISFDSITKSFGTTEVLKGIDAEVAENEFLVLLGPSGCGKSTLLRIIAGLATPTSGSVRFDGESIEQLEPHERGVAFVFQSYALYPHMTVRGNIAFPLIMEHFKWYHHTPVVNGFVKRILARRPEVADKVAAVAETLELTDYLDRRPKALSGGQRQRVAVARALVREPAVYLLDEPLSNLDAKLRTQMRTEITSLYETVKKTFIYVTHDQIEAMTMGTQIIVMNDGEIQQSGTPQEIYDYPANTFVARFIGSPPMNLIPATVAGSTLRLQSGIALDAPMRPADRAEVLLGLRPENISLVGDGDDTAGADYDIRSSARGDPGADAEACVRVVEHLGAETLVGFSFGPSDGSTIGARDARRLYYMKTPGTSGLVPGDEIGLSLNMARARWFDPDDGSRIGEDGMHVGAADA